MLLNLLPGLRDLRTPLAVGYLWLAVLWLMWESRLPASGEATGVLASIYRVGELVGSTAVLAAISFVAYLVGAVMSPLSRLLSTKINRSPRRVLQVRNLYPDLGTFVMRELLELRRDERFDMRRYDTGIQRLSREPVSTNLDFPTPPEVNTVVEQVRRELPSIVARLQVFDKEQLYQSYDRSMSEADFRGGVVPPLIALDIFLCLQVSPWWLLGLVVPLVLVWETNQKYNEAVRIAYQAIMHGIIPSSTLASLRQASLRPE